MKLHILLIILTTLNFNFVFADGVVIDEKLENEVDRFLDDDTFEVSPSEFNTIDYLTKIRTSTDTVIIPSKKQERFKSHEEVLPKKYKASLKKKAILKDINTNKALINHQKMYVVAQEIYTEGKYSYVFDKKNVARYITLTKNLASIENELRLHPLVDASKVHKKVKSYRSTDKVLPLESHISISKNYYNVRGLSNVLNRQEESAKATSFEYRLFHKSILPVHFGLATQLQQGQFDLLNESFESPNWTAFYIGPLLRYQTYSSYKYNLNLIAGFKRSVYYNVNTETGSYSFSNTIWNLEVEGVFKTKYGNFFLSLGRVNQAQSFKPNELSDSSTLKLNNEKEQLTATTLSLGYQYEFSL